MYWWNIGPDPRLSPRPKYAGDVLGRALSSSLLGPLGHVGIWLGDLVGEVNDQKPNAARTVKFEDFVAPGDYWGAAESNVPAQYIYYCFDAKWCPAANGFNYRDWVWARDALVKRAYQIIAVGADYTPYGSYEQAFPAWGSYADGSYHGAQRGRYRCDTFIDDVFQSSGGSNLGHPVDAAWQVHLEKLRRVEFRTPRTLWNYIDQTM